MFSARYRTSHGFEEFHESVSGENMATARVIKWGKGQAVLLPRAFRLKCKELEIWRNGEEIVLREKKKGIERALQLLQSLPADMFPDGNRDDPPPQHRKGLVD